MFENLIVPLLLSLLIYLYLPTPETNFLVIFSSNDRTLDREQIEQIGNVTHAFKIIRNVDGHMQHVDVKSKLDFNYAVLTNNREGQDEETFKKTIKHQKFIDTFEVFPYRTNPLRLTLINSFIRVKGFFVDSSLTKSSATDSMEDVLEMCGEDNMKDISAKVMINVISEKPGGGKEEMEKYSTPIIFSIFPRIKARLLMAGSALSDHWTTVALMEYTTGYEGICRMAESEEYLQVYQHKVLGLRDTHTYWSQQIF